MLRILRIDMDVKGQLYRLLNPIRKQISLILGRALLSALDDSKGLQLLQVSILSDELKDGIERVQNYGFTSNPPPGSEVLLGRIGGSTDQTIAISVDSSKDRKKSLSTEDVAVYRKGGDYILLSSDKVEIFSSKKIILNCSDVTLGGGSGGTGVVTGQCICAFTGAVHPDVSTKVKAVK
jgi:phage baseplate assembly protein V